MTIMISTTRCNNNIIYHPLKVCDVDLHFIGGGVDTASDAGGVWVAPHGGHYNGWKCV